MNGKVRRLRTWDILAVLFALPVSAGTSVTAEPVVPGQLVINSGRILVDDTVALTGISVYQSRARFLFFYHPGDGLWILSAHEFPDGLEGGSFEHHTLHVAVDGRTLRIESKKPILGEGTFSAWVRHDPTFALETEVPMFGYGDREDEAYAWKRYLGAD